MSKKVYTLTFHRSKSHGALLQCYALNKFLNLNNYDAYVLDYRPHYFDEYNSIFPIKNHGSSNLLKGLIKNLFLIQYRLKLEKKFNQFRKEIRMGSEKYSLFEDIKSKKYNSDDIFICGSDQIWNPEITGNAFDPVYFIDFTNKAKKIAYAASTGVVLNEKKQIEYINQKLSCFDLVLVRENSTLSLFNENILRKSYVVCDPVFLLSKEDWFNIIGEKQIIKSKYILIYDLSFNEILYKQAIEYAKNNDLIIVEVARPEIQRHYSSSIQRKIIASPSELVNLIYYSEYVFTNSFHGTCFSIIFNKQFEVLVEPTRGGRITSLLSIFNLENRILGRKIPENIDFNYLNEEIKKYSDYSKEKLLEVLK